jgi:tripartite-type tricarboxylate transporter receptor subunit TctC
MLRIISAVATLAVAAGVSAAAAQEDAAAFYQGRNLTFVVPYGPGGGFDQYARMLAPHLEERIGTTVVVENRPGGGGMTAINQLASGQADGSTIAILNGVPAALGQITEAPAIRFDLTALTYIARVNAEPWVLLVSAHSGHESLEDLVEASQNGGELTFGGTGRADGPTDAAAVVCAALELNCRMVVGFQGSSEVSLAAIRGDVTGFAVTDRSARDYSQGSEDLIPVAVIGRERSDLLPDVPTIFEAVDVPEEYWIDFRGGIVDVGRAIVAAPGAPEDRVAFLRQAFEEVLTDPDVLAEAEEKGLPIVYASGAEVQATIEEVLGDIPEDRLAEIRDVLIDRYF